MLIKKMLRDMKGNSAQFISIFLMALLGVFIYSGLNSSWYAMENVVNDYYKETQIADLWIIGESFSNEDVKKVQDIKDVLKTSTRLTFDGMALLEGKPALRINIVKDANLSSFKSQEGVAFDKNLDGVWLDKSFAEAFNLKVGDIIKIEYTGLKLNKEILGLVIHPEYVHNVKDETTITPDPKTFGFCYLSAMVLEDIEMMKPLFYNQILIKVQEGKEVGVKEKLEEVFSDRYVMIIDHKIHPSVSIFENEIDQTKAIANVFPVVFFLIAALTLLTTMTRITTSQRSQIAVLKAIGFSRKKILFHYLSYGLWLGLIGGIIGLFAGPYVIPPILFKMQETMYTLPKWPVLISPVSLVSLIIAVLCCGASSYFACIKQLKEVPASGLRPSMPKAKTHTKIEKTSLWHGMSFSTQWNLRDVLRSKVRTIMAIIGVMGSTALLMFGLGLRDTIIYLNHWQNEILNVYETRIDIEENVSHEVKDLIFKRYQGQWIQESGIEIKRDLKKESEKKNGILTVLTKGDQIVYKDTNEKTIKLPVSGIALSSKIASSLEVSEGDKIYWRMYGEKDWKNTKVEVIYRSALGQGISMTEEALIDMGGTMTSSALLTSKMVSEKDKVTGIKGIRSKGGIKEGLNKVLESMMAIVVILIFASLILGSVVLYNLGVLSFSEKIREFATLKVLGFYSKKIKGLMLKQNLWTTLTGIVFGIPGGYWLISFMMETMPESMDMKVFVSIKSWIITVLGIFLLSFIVSMILGRRIRDIDMVSSLKSVE